MKQNLKMYTTAPLPFQGQKRRYVREFSKIITQTQFPIYVDLFGGSGLLSHVAKRVSPSSRVIYNDFDGYHIRLKHIAETNILLASLREILSGYPREKRIAGELRDKVMGMLEKANAEGFVDWITISSSLLFSMNYALSFAEFKKQSFYNNIRTVDYDTSNYLDGLEITQMDYRKLFGKYKNNSDVIFFVDPPYLSTDVSTYTSMEYWKLRDYLDVLNILKGSSFIYFTSSKSQVVELSEWCGVNLGVLNPFSGAIKTEVNTNSSHNAKYVDIMLCKLNNKQAHNAS